MVDRMQIRSECIMVFLADKPREQIVFLNKVVNYFIQNVKSFTYFTF